MHRAKWHFILVFIASLFTGQLLAQENEQGQYIEIEAKDKVADVLIYTGHIAEGTNKDTMYIMTEVGVLVKVAYADIIAMSSQKGMLTDPKENQKEYDWDIEERRAEENDVYKFRERGVYATIGPDLNFKTRDFFEVFGGAEIAVGYRFNRLFTLGAGAGIRSWTWDISPNTVGSVFAESRGYFLAKKVSPYYRVKAGYGNAINNANPDFIFFNDFESSDGGLYFSPSIGVRFLGHSKFQLNLETGLNYQEVTYYNTGFGALERSYKFSRHYIGISFMY